MAARSFDVAVVGAGAAGCVVASRLSEGGARSVVLLEAGGRAPDDQVADLHDGWTLPKPPDWGFATEPDEDGAVVALRRGKVLGGTGWLTRFALRGSPADFDEWAALGNPGWAFDDVVPVFRRLEADAEFGDRPWHGDRGPIPITRYPGVPRMEALDAVVAAAVAAGFPLVEDHNAPGAVGVGPMPMSSAAGLRATTLDAYLGDAGPRPNLVIRPDAEVGEVTIAGGAATGVRLIDGTLVEAARVVLCAGTYGSPSILLRSGIGPAGHLREMGVAVQVDLLGVGSNLADHPATDLDLGYEGPGRASPLLHSVATFHSRSRGAGEAPDLMLWLADPEPLDRAPQLTIGVVLLKPHARGSVRLRSADPTAVPRIRLPDVTTDPVDLERLAEGYRRALEVAAASSVRRLVGARGPRAALDHGELLDRVRAELWSAPHVVGTCAMGPSPADGAVVDAVGRVHGVDGLFVADASTMPMAPSGFTHLPTIMIAERLAERVATGGLA
jgi:choline dehydrogenase